MSDPPADNRPSIELLEAQHTFPGPFHFKVIGTAAGDFVDRVRAAALEGLPADTEVTVSLRPSRDNRHVSVMLDVQVRSAEEVRAIYARLAQVAGVSMLL